MKGKGERPVFYSNPILVYLPENTCKNVNLIKERTSPPAPLLTKERGGWNAGLKPRF
jgi:hypothetical protein